MIAGIGIDGYDRRIAKVFSGGYGSFCPEGRGVVHVIFGVPRFGV